ncbi:LOW QUALITY PROTEIN: hypothetical protein Cgig2_023131 [Carnegiea gigantea]|uniref:Ubiquitin-like protease family profile domain-containing protein n=1 Tax=Carnegiea gigantea TaxID=171969 RepID=A0A9Q1JRM5_9CARY|nr:LOW QUALITY PROTEIN: hypothetical protein Cgig2_023131 [Carnegiea gigantea]
MPLLETTEGHWLLLVADLREWCFFVYDSLRSPANKNRRELVENARIALVLAFLPSTTYADAAQWEVVTPKCPEQRKTIVHDILQPGLFMYMLPFLFHNGHDCGVFVMAYMELLSLKADGFHFDQDRVARYRDRCLLSFPQGRVAHFPQHLTVSDFSNLVPLQLGFHNSLVRLRHRPCRMAHSKWLSYVVQISLMLLNLPIIVTYTTPDIDLLHLNGPVIVIHTHHCMPIDKLSSTHTIYGDACMELYTSIAGGRVVDTYTYTPLYKVNVLKEGEVDGEEQLSHTGS